MKKIKNNTGSTKTWRGQEIASGAYYTLEENEYDAWMADPELETVINSGDAIFNDGAQDFTDPAEGLDMFKAVDASCIRGVTVDDTNKADGLGLKYDSASGKIIYGTVGTISSEMPSIQMKRDTDDVLDSTPTNITFNLTPIENDISVLEHDNTNTDRMNIGDTGGYLLGINLICENTSAQDKTLSLRLRIDDTTTMATLLFGIPKGSIEVFSRTIPVTLTSGSYVTIDAEQVEAGTNLTLVADSVFWAVRLTGQKGNTGATGSSGADGDITWQGNWVSQNYTANQAVKYTDGNSYVCHTNTVSSEIPTNTSYWDILAEKGDTGTAQSRIDISIHPHNDSKKSTLEATYQSQAKFIWGGSTLLGTPTKIYANSFMDTAGSGKVKIYDLTNATVICENASITSTSSGNIVDLGTISNIPTDQAVFEIQLAGDGTNICNISSLSLEF